MVCCALLYVLSSFAIILMGKRELVALLCLSSWSQVICVLLFLMMPRAYLQFAIVAFPDHTHILFLIVFLMLCGCWWSVFPPRGALDWFWPYCLPFFVKSFKLSIYEFWKKHRLIND